MLRFSLATLFAIVLLAALGAASLKYASPLANEITATALFGFLVVSALLAVHGRGRLRRFFNGFAITGWAYLVALFLFLFIGGDGGIGREPRMITERVSGLLYESMHNVAPHKADDVIFTPDASPPPDLPEGVPRFEDFLRICHALTAMTLACCGGAFVCALPTRDGQRNESGLPAREGPTC